MTISLTKKIIATAQPKDRPFEVRDAQVRGLILRVQPTGRKVWIVTWAHGKRRTLGSAEYLSLDQARELARKVIAEFIQVGLPSIAKPVLPRVTLEQFVLDHYLPWAREELKDAEDAFRRLRQAFPKFLLKPLAEIEPSAIEQWWVTRLKDKVSPISDVTISKATATRNLATLSSILSKAVKWKMLEENPIPATRLKLAKSRSVVRFLSPAEEQRLRDALIKRDHAVAAARASANDWRKARKYPLLPEIHQGCFASHLTPLILLAINTGLRRGELLSLHWSDINLDSKILTVRSENAKSGKQRHIPLNTEAIAVLGQWRSEFDGNNKVFGIKSIKSSWVSLLTTAKIHDFRFHDLRHHFASRLVMSGVDLNTIRELLGHANLTMTLRYAHLAPAHLAAAVERLTPQRNGPSY